MVPAQSRAVVQDERPVVPLEKYMKLPCPACGAVASADAWANDVNCRETMLVVSRLASPLPKAVLGYLSLFRPGKQALTWKKALRLALEIEQLVATGYVHVQGKVDRTCPPSLWARAMEQMVEQRGALRLPMASHNYLSKIAWDLADSADYQAEKKQSTTQMSSRTRPREGADPDVYDPDAVRKEYYRKMNGAPADTVNLDSIPTIIKGMD
jgi:hypothetical protein